MILLNVLHFLFVTLLFHPLFLALADTIIILIIINRLSARRIDVDYDLWIQTLPSSNNIRLVWCDPYLKTEDITETHLRKIDPALVLVTDVSLCQTIIKNIHHDECKSIFLILPESIANDLLSHVTPDVHTIFIFSFDKKEYVDLKNQTKVKIVSDSLEELNECIKECWSLLERRFAYEHEQKTFRNLSKETATFLWFHILRNVIDRLQKSSQVKNDLMIRLREYFQGNQVQLNELIEFADIYESDHILWWYTRPNFISDVINKAIRSQDIDALFDLRYFIIDLCHSLQESPRPKKEFNVYRAVLIDRDKFNKMQKTIKKDDGVPDSKDSKRYVSMRGFLWRSLDREMCMIFGSNDNQNPNKVWSK